MSNGNIYLVWQNHLTRDFINQSLAEAAPNATVIECDSNSSDTIRIANSGSCEIVVTDNFIAGNHIIESEKYLPIVSVCSELNPIQNRPHLGSQPLRCSMADPADVRLAIQEAMASSRLFIKLKTNQIKLSDLNPRERSVVMMAAEGVPNKTIARRLNVSVKTIEHCRRKAYLKLDVKSSAEVASLITFDKFFSLFESSAGSMPDMPTFAG